jgi:hypothetical protein
MSKEPAPPAFAVLRLNPEQLTIVTSALDDSIQAQQFLLAQIKEARARRLNTNILDTDILVQDRYDATCAIRADLRAPVLEG